MSDLMQILASSLDRSTVDRLGNQIGADRQQTESALSAALPLLVGALAGNANRSKDEARSLAHALERDHDGGLLDQVGALLGQAGGGGGLGDLLGMAGSLLGGQGGSPKAADGAGILRHVLGGRKEPVAKGIGKASGLDMGQVQQLLIFLAPLVMGALGKMKRERDLDPDGLTAALNRERAELEEQAPGMSRGGLLGLLDADDDGQVMDDVANLGAALHRSGVLGKLFG